MAGNELTTILQMVDVLSTEDQRKLYHHLAQKLTDQESSESQFKQRLLEAGILSEIKPPIQDLGPYQKRKLVKVSGKPLSETVIEERR